MYRIISGRWKGKRVIAPKNFDVRPTTDFAKEALFSILNNRFDFEYISVLDLFAGIGSISLELASRYCGDITAVDIERKHTTFIQNTAKTLELDKALNIISYNVYDYLAKQRNYGKQFDLIFADPPFKTEDSDYQKLIELIMEGDFLKENGIFVLEHQSKRKIDHPTVTEVRKYGNVSFAFFNKK